MTTRFHSLTVVLDKDLRDDDAEPLMDAIRMLRGVLKVSGVAADLTSNMAQARARQELLMKLIETAGGKE